MQKAKMNRVTNNNCASMQRGKLLMKKRKCAECGASLTNEDVMKIGFEDGSWQVIPLPIYPDCFTKRMVEQARSS